MNHIFEFMVEINWTRLNFTNLRNQTISHSTCRHYHLRLFVDRLSYATGIMLGNPKRKMIRAKYLDLWHPFLILCSLSTTYLESFSCSQQRILMEKWFQKISYPVKPILVSKFTPKKTLKKLGCPGRRFPTKSKSKFCSISYSWWFKKPQGQPPAIYEKNIYLYKKKWGQISRPQLSTHRISVPSNSMSSVSRQQRLQEIAHVVSGPSVLETARSRPWKESTSPVLGMAIEWPFQWF